MNGLIALLIGLVILVGVFFLASYLMMLAWNASVPILFSGANPVDNFWVFVIFALFLAIAGAIWHPTAGPLGGITRRPRILRRLL